MSYQTFPYLTIPMQNNNDFVYQRVLHSIMPQNVPLATWYFLLYLNHDVWTIFYWRDQQGNKIYFIVFSENVSVFSSLLTFLYGCSTISRKRIKCKYILKCGQCITESIMFYFCILSIIDSKDRKWNFHFCISFTFQCARTGMPHLVQQDIKTSSI